MAIFDADYAGGGTDTVSVSVITGLNQIDFTPAITNKKVTYELTYNEALYHLIIDDDCEVTLVYGSLNRAILLVKGTPNSRTIKVTRTYID